MSRLVRDIAGCKERGVQVWVIPKSLVVLSAVCLGTGNPHRLAVLFAPLMLAKSTPGLAFEDSSPLTTKASWAGVLIAVFDIEVYAVYRSDC